MDSNAVCTFLVAVVWLSSLPRVLASVRAEQRGWAVVYAGLLALFATGLGTFPEHAGHVTAAAYGVLVVLPSLVARRLAQLMAGQRFEAAVAWARVYFVLHPLDGSWALPALLAALLLARAGELSGADAALSALVRTAPPSMARQARMHAFRLRGDWAGFLAATAALTQQQLRDDPGTLNGRLRALGETGALDALVAAYTAAKGALAGTPHLLQHAYAQLFVAAFTGRVGTLTRLFDGPLKALDTATQRFWTATASYALGHTEPARAQLAALSNDPNHAVANAARQRLATPPALVAGALSAGSLAALSELERELGQAERFDDTAPLARARLCLALIAVNLAGFAYELLLGGSERMDALYEAGALVAGELSAHDGYRLITALFLHFGWLHLAMNMLNLAAIGPYVEASLGALRSAVVYLGAGLLGALIVALVPPAEPTLFLGASGCIMGLLGATAAILLHGYRRERALPARRRLWRIALVLAVQLLFDLSIPGISLIAHWTGVLTGALITYGFVLQAGRSQPALAERTTPR